MKQYTIKLTEAQLEETIHALEEDINYNYPKSDPYNRFIQRIIDKLNKAKVA